MKTETGIYMYNYGRNIALKLQVVEERTETGHFLLAPWSPSLASLG